MIKFLRRFIFFLILLFIGGILCRNMVGSWVTISALERVTGFSASMDSLELYLTQPCVAAHNIVLWNPRTAYQERRAIAIKELEAVYKPEVFLKRELHFPKLLINISEIVAVKNAEGQINLQQLQNSIQPSSQKTDRKFQIDELVLSIGKILYIDEKTGKTITYPIDMKDRVYKNIQSSADVKKLVLNVIVRSLPQNLMGITQESLGKEMDNLLEKGTKTVFEFINPK